MLQCFSNQHGWLIRQCGMHQRHSPWSIIIVTHTRTHTYSPFSQFPTLLSADNRFKRPTNVRKLDFTVFYDWSNEQHSVPLTPQLRIAALHYLTCSKSVCPVLTCFAVSLRNRSVQIYFHTRSVAFSTDFDVCYWKWPQHHLRPRFVRLTLITGFYNWPNSLLLLLLINIWINTFNTQVARAFIDWASLTAVTMIYSGVFSFPQAQMWFVVCARVCVCVVI